MKIPAPHGHLEAHVRPEAGPLRGVAVVCHPHPEHGGTMHTKAVFRTAQALGEVGIRALRFNFRGVGLSTGRYDEGRGEQDDVRAALDFLAGEEPDAPLFLAGFSFGSLVGLKVARDDARVRACVALGLPLSSYDFSFLRDMGKPVRVIQGEDDEFGGGAEVETLLEGMGDHLSLVRIPRSDHYFHDRYDELKEAVQDFFTNGAAASLRLGP